MEESLDGYYLVDLPPPYTAVPYAIIEDEDLSIYAKMTYIALCCYSNGQTYVDFPSYAEIAEMCSCDEKTVIEAIDELQQTGYLEIEKGKPGFDGQYSNIYKLNTTRHKSSNNQGNGEIEHMPD